MDRRGSTIVRTIPKTAIPVYIVNQKHFEKYKPININFLIERSKNV